MLRERGERDPSLYLLGSLWPPQIVDARILISDRHLDIEKELIKLDIKARILISHRHLNMEKGLMKLDNKASL